MKFFLSSLSLQVVPIITQLKEDLSSISEEDVGVKTLKRKLLASVEQRLGDLETQEMYSVSCCVDPRSWMSGFSKEENRIKARELLIQRVKEAMPSPPVLDRRQSSSSASTSDESWEEAAKRRKMEKQAQVIIIVLL